MQNMSAHANDDARSQPTTSLSKVHCRWKSHSARFCVIWHLVRFREYLSIELDGSKVCRPWYGVTQGAFAPVHRGWRLVRDKRDPICLRQDHG